MSRYWCFLQKGKENESFYKREKEKANEMWQERNHVERSHVSTFPTEKALADWMDSETALCRACHVLTRLQILVKEGLWILIIYSRLCLTVVTYCIRNGAKMNSSIVWHTWRGAGRVTPEVGDSTLFTYDSVIATNYALMSCNWCSIPSFV